MNSQSWSQRMYGKVNLDCPAEWENNVIPAWAENKLEDGVQTEKGVNTRKTIFALIQWHIAESPDRCFTPKSIHERHNKHYSENQYRTHIQAIAEAGLIEPRPEAQGLYCIPDDRKLGDKFQTENPSVRVSAGQPDPTDRSPCALVPGRLLEAIYQRFPGIAYNQYLRKADVALVFACLGVIQLLFSPIAAPISTTSPGVIVTWAVFSFAFAALAVGSTLEFLNLRLA